MLKVERLYDDYFVRPRQLQLQVFEPECVLGEEREIAMMGK
jgi:hypothetical protein